MDVLAALFHPLEPCLLMLCTDTSQSQSLERYLNPLSLPVEGLQPELQTTFDYEKAGTRSFSSSLAVVNARKACAGSTTSVAATPGPRCWWR